MPIPTRSTLPQLQDRLFLTDSGLETTLVFHHGIKLPAFSSLVCLRSPEQRALLEDYFRRHLDLAVAAGAGFVLESCTWRASRDWAAALGMSREDLHAANREAVRFMVELRAEYRGRIDGLVLSGNLGPRGDGYQPGAVMSPEEAEEYHREQVQVFAGTSVDMCSALTINNVPEAVGIVRAAREAALPVVVSFTVETDGRLPTGETLAEAITRVDAATDAGAAYFGINCAHPQHFAAVLEDAPWLRRVRMLRANASTCSHAELDEATELDSGDPAGLGAEYAALLRRFPWLNVLGGCCGTDHRHVAEISAAARVARGLQATR